jgi:hypothetical protein
MIFESNYSAFFSSSLPAYSINVQTLNSIMFNGVLSYAVNTNLMITTLSSLIVSAIIPSFKMMLFLQANAK